MKTDNSLLTPGAEQVPTGHGVVCRHCGCHHLPVYYTRRSQDRIIRCRECSDCGRRMVTSEKAL